MMVSNYVSSTMPEMPHTEPSICSYRLEMGVPGNLWIVVKDVKTLVVYDVE